MEDLNDKITGTSLIAIEWNQVPTELQNVIVHTGQTLSGGDLVQLEKSISAYGAGGAFYQDSGIADAYVLSPIGAKLAPPAYFDGMEINFIAGNTNTGAATVNVATLGVKNLLNRTADTLLEGDILAGVLTQATFSVSNDAFIVENAAIHALVYKTVNQSIPDDTLTAVDQTTIEYDSSGFFDLLNPTRLTVPFSGYWRVNACVPFGANTIGERQARIFKNGVVFVGTPRVQYPAVSTGGRAARLTLSTADVFCNAGDFFELFAQQNSGANLNILGDGSGDGVWFSITEVRK